MAAHDTPSRSDLRLLDPRKTRFRADAWGRLHLEIGIEERYGPVRVIRCLPLTRPNEYLSVQDDEGEEIGILRNLQELEPESRRLVEQELNLYYLTSRVRAIHRVENKNGILSWDVTTDRGRKTVHIRDRQHIRPLPDGRIILTDIHDAKYEVPPLETLDERSRHWLEIEL